MEEGKGLRLARTSTPPSSAVNPFDLAPLHSPSPCPIPTAEPLNFEEGEGLGVDDEERGPKKQRLRSVAEALQAGQRKRKAKWVLGALCACVERGGRKGEGAEWMTRRHAPAQRCLVCSMGPTVVHELCDECTQQWRPWGHQREAGR